MNGLDFSDISKLNEKYAREPKSRIFVQLADAYRKNKMIDEALDVLNKGIEYHPQYALAYLVIGKCYYDTRAHVQAKDAFEKTIALDPQNVVALRMLAKTYEMLKDDKGQINAYKSIIAIDPLDTQAKEKLSMLEALQRKEPLYTVAMAEEYEKQGNIEESLKIYENLLYTDPSDLILRQKTAELKKAVEDKRKKTDEEKILDLQLQRMFQPEELKDTKPTTDADRPAKEKAPDWNVTKQPLTAEDGIQRLEDFLVEELEHATGRTMTQSSDSKPENQPITLPDERTPQEETSSPAPAVSDGISESTAITGTDSDQDAVAPTREILCQEIKWDDMLAAESAEDADKPTKDADKPTKHADRPAEEKRVQEPEHPAIDQGPAQVVLDTWPRITEPEIPVEETPAPAVNADRPAQPADKPASDIATLETGDKKGEGEQTKKPSEDDFKSFQDWLSGLLK